MKSARKSQPEFEFQKALAKYISMRWPNVNFLSDTRSGVRLTRGQAGILASVQKSGFKCPDLMIFAARRGYHGLFLELKASSPFKKDGSLRSDEHLEAQEATMRELRRDGYMALFAWDWNSTTKFIDDYLGGE